jgi:predicted esterase
LDWIVMKALEKQRERRYDTSAELSADINRHLNHQPVQAAAPSLPYKIRKFIRRRRIDILVASLVGAATLTVTAILILMWIFAAPRAYPSDTMSSIEDWIERLKGLGGHNSAAFGVGPELVKLDPDFGLKVVEAAWPELTDFQVKRGLLKAFHFSKPLHPKKHPYVLKILHLGMTDRDEKVREYAAVYIKEYALEDFSGNSENYLKWYKECGNLSIEEVIRLNQNRKIPVLKEKLKEIIDEFEKGDMDQVQRLGQEISRYGNPYAIPTLIGIIDADNSYDTIYGIGYFALGFSIGLGPVTKVKYSPYHDGAWWHRWWENNKSRFPEEVQKIPIPDLPKTEHGKNHTPFPENMDTLKGCLAWLLKIFEDGGDRTDVWDIAREISEFGDPNAIPTLIAMIEADNTYDTIYGIGYFGLGRLTGVRYSEKHDGTWWRNWWEANKSKYPEDVQKMEIPDYHELVASWRKKVEEKENNRALADVENVPAEDLTVGGNAEMSYFLIGAAKDAAPPEGGYNLVVIMPGGDGGKNFHPFVRRVYKYALSNKFLVAQPVAFKWNDKQKIAWPTKDHPTNGQKFAMEDFIEAVIQDVKKYHKINERNIFTLSWSSGGPAAYAVSLNKNTQVKGSFIAMSVFRRDWLPPLDTAKGHIYYLLHSPEDKVCPFSHAKQAEVDLTEAGAIVRLDTCEGGHGWHGDVYGHIQRGISWLIEQVDKAESASKR